MTLQEALTILTTFQLWRISDDEVHMQKPSEVTNALDVLLNHCAGALELPQQELSDEEIEQLAKDYILYNDSKRQWYIEGMKIYREQLRNKQ